MKISKKDLDYVIINMENGQIIRYFSKGLDSIISDAKWDKGSKLKVITYQDFETNRTKLDKMLCKIISNQKSQEKTKKKP
mgnify:FL=1